MPITHLGQALGKTFRVLALQANSIGLIGLANIIGTLLHSLCHFSADSLEISRPTSAITTHWSIYIPIQLQAPAPTVPLGASVADTAGTTAAATNQTVGGINRESSIWSFIWLAMTFGALSLLTPCVFPMVPIPVSYFTNHAAGNRRAALRDAVIYALGIILTFRALGVALAVLFGEAGINKFAASPWATLSSR